MFNKNFYPTPVEVAEIMLEGYEFKYTDLVLEPSAGKGDLAEVAIKKFMAVCGNRYSYDPEARRKRSMKHFHVIEQEPDLQAVLRSKGWNLIDQDFLSHPFEKQYSLILMNPPFDTGAKHLLYALEKSPGSEVRCLLNAETLNNACTKEREALAVVLNQRGAQVKSLGRCFMGAERSTQVETVLVICPGQPQANRFEFDPSSIQDREKTQHTVGDIQNSALETTNVLDSMVNRFEKIKELGVQMLRLENEIKFYANGMCDTGFLKTLKDDYRSYEDFVDHVRKACWDSVFNQTKLANYVTESVKARIQTQQELQGSMSFTSKNIYTLLQILMGSLQNIKKDCVEEAFDLLTKYHEENRKYVEGWKTNSAWKANQKCILGWQVEASWSKNYKIKCESKVSDLERALSLVAGVEYSEILKQEQDIKSCAKDQVTGVWHDSYFFEFKMFKKGTLHIKFKDRDLHEQFNLEACKAKNWIGNGK